MPKLELTIDIPAELDEEVVYQIVKEIAIGKIITMQKGIKKAFLDGISPQSPEF